ncbi:MAG: FIST C-terminal domain-containing protein [Bernardetiaceae bacterium]|nr:FIST C-terminal domain-containing protein [Bernardetiaceae bacterium]
MITKFDNTGSIANLQSILKELEANAQIKSMLILAADGNDFTPDKVNAILQAIKKPIIGATFPEVIYETSHFTKGTVVLGLEKSMHVAIIEGLSDERQFYADIIDEAFPEVDNAATTIVFVDGLSQRIGNFIHSLFNVFGLDTNFIGGGGGSLTLKQKPCILSNQGLLEDCAIIGLLDMQSALGVKHGWKTIAGSFEVTSSENTVIKTLNHRPAFEVYKEVVEKHSGLVFDDTNFFDIAKAYPFGIVKLDAEMVVRDPLFLQPETQALVCVGEVPEGVFIDILNGSAQGLIDAAREARETSENSKKNNDVIRIFIDCISRVLFLGDDFNKELEAVATENLPMVGACTLGEIANNQGTYLEFYNKTAVIINLKDN